MDRGVDLHATAADGDQVRYVKRSYPTNKERADAFAEWVAACDLARVNGVEHLIEKHMYKRTRGNQVLKIKTAALNLRIAVNKQVAAELAKTNTTNGTST